MNMVVSLRNFLLPTPRIKPEGNKFYLITQSAYLIGLIGHGLGIFMFYKMGVLEMTWFNILVSVPSFALAMVFNFRGWLNLAFMFAFLELLLHQVCTTYYLGWSFGAHYWLIYLAGLSFFNTQWSLKTHFKLLGVVIVAYFGLFIFYREGVYPSITSAYLHASLYNALAVVVVLSLLIYYFATTTQRAEQKLKAEQALTSAMLAKIESLFGQQVSKEIAHEMIESEREIESKAYHATMMFLDIRDFTVFADSRDPAEVTIFQNTVFGTLIEIVRRHNGVVLQILGDGLMAVFGAPVVHPEHALHAVKASLEMLEGIEELIAEGKIPPIRIGIGLNSGNIIAGNLGNQDRKFYSLTGKNVIIAARIEPFNKQFDSQILISEYVYKEVSSAGVEGEYLGKVNLKGIELPVGIYKLK